jgi:hypothetical protein
MPIRKDRDQDRAGADVVALRHLHFSLQEIADRCGLSRLAVFRQLQRALSRNERIALGLPVEAA